jgi:hypothetical protein
MNIYTTVVSNGFELCHPVAEKDFETIVTLIDGTPRAARWTPIPVEVVHEDEGKALEHSDSPWLGGHALIFRKGAVQALAPILESHGELLPLDCPEAELVAFNVTKVVNALDEKSSSILRFDDGSIMYVQKHVFIPEVVEGLEIFKIAGIRASSTYVSDAFVSKWKSAKLRGLDFTRVAPTDEA